MNTSYYSKYKGENAVSIAGKCPVWYKGKEYKKLAPKYWFFKEYKDPSSQFYMDEDYYIQNYQKEVLDKLDAKKVYEELGENAVLLCWEKSDKFCHRHLVAKWLEKELGIKVSEI